MFEKRSDTVRFLAVVEADGLGRAADRLDMTQPALKGGWRRSPGERSPPHV